MTEEDPFRRIIHSGIGIVVIAACVASGCSSGAAVREAAGTYSRSNSGVLFEKVQSEVYIIKEGDKIEVSVWDYPEFNTTATVSAEGTITIPLVGDVKASGMTKDDFTNALKSKLAEYVKGTPKITVAVSSPTTQKIAVLGAVTRQDNYPVTSEVSLLEILSAAGGTTADSDLNRVRIIRFGTDDDPIVVDLADAIETGKVDELPKVKPGDTVYVPKRENFVRSFSDFLRDAVLLFGFFRVLY